MAKNEKTSQPVATLAAKVLDGYSPTPEQIRTLAASVLTQAPDKQKPKREKD